MYGVVICDNSCIELGRGRMVKSQSNKSMTPLYVDTHFEYELDMKLFPGLNNPEARIQPSLMIHKDDGCPCQQNADIDLQNLIGKFLSVILEAIRTVFLFSQNLIVNSFDIIPFISNIYKIMYKEQHAELLRIVVMHLKV
jgi:hypothetical protein